MKLPEDRKPLEDCHMLMKDLEKHNQIDTYGDAALRQSSKAAQSFCQ